MTEFEYLRLSSEHQGIYRQLFETLKTGAVSVKITGTDNKDTVIKIYRTMLKDHPDIFWLNSGMTYTYGKKNGVDFVNLEPNWRDDFTPSNIGKHLEIFNIRVAKIVNAAKRYKTEYAKALALHDFIIDTCDYDGKAKHKYTAYGALVDKRAVCAGYSAAYQLLCNLVGLECGRVVGKDYNDGPNDPGHEWNYIKLNDKYYYVDVTWDDPTVNQKLAEDNKQYIYFAITTEELEKTHIIDNEYFTPECNSKEMNYFIFSGRYCEKYDFAKVSAIIALQMRIGTKASVKFFSEKECEKALTDLIDKNNIYKVKGVCNPISYSVSNDKTVFKIFNK